MMQIEVVKLPAMNFIGCSTFTDGSGDEIPEIWDVLLQDYEKIENNINPNKMFGIEFYSSDFDERERWNYMACVETDKINDIPSHFIAKTIPEAEYAKAVFKGKYENIDKVYDYLYNEWLEKNGYIPGDWYDIEIYDMDKFFGSEDEKSEIEIYIPIIKK